GEGRELEYSLRGGDRLRCGARPLVEERMNPKSLFSRLLRWSSGQSLIEFGMVLPFLLVVGFAVTEFGRALWTQNVLTEAGGAGARAAMMPGPDTYQTKAQEAADHVLTLNKMGISVDGGAVVTAELVTLNGYQNVRVKVTRDFNFIPSGNGGGLPTRPGAGYK